MSHALTFIVAQSIVFGIFVAPAMVETPKDPIDARYLKERRAHAQRVASRFSFDYMRAAVANGKPPDVEPIGPALQRMYAAEMALDPAVPERLTIAERYNRLAYRLWAAERYAFDLGRIVDSNFESRLRFYAQDAAVEVVKARRANGLQMRIANESGYIVPEFTAAEIVSDLVFLLLNLWRIDSNSDSGPAPLLPDVLTVMQERPDQLRRNADAELAAVLATRWEMASRYLAIQLQVFQAGAKGGTIEQLLTALQNWLRSELELSARPIDRMKCYERTLRVLKGIEPVVEQRFEAGQIHEADVERVRKMRIDLHKKWRELSDHLRTEMKPAE